MSRYKRAEDYIYTEWRLHAVYVEKTTGQKRQAERAIADALQYLLQDMSPYGHSLVFGPNRPR